MIKTLEELKNKIKRKEFSVTYEEAIDLKDLTPVDYFWKQTSTGAGLSQKLLHIQLPEYSGLKFIINIRGKKDDK